MTLAWPSRDRLSVWCGGCLLAALLLMPVLGWVGPLGFAPIVGVAGALCLPVLTVREADRPVYIAGIMMLIWAVGSTVWSPYHHDLWGSPALKLVAEAVFYFAFVCAARRAEPGMRERALLVFAWGLPILGLAIFAEAVTAAQGYRTLRAMLGEPLRPDLAAKNVAQGLFVLALLWPLAAVAAQRTGAALWLTAPTLAGLIGGSVAFGYDAPILALAVAGIVGAAVWLWPVVAPRVLAGLTAAFFMLMPLAVWILQTTGVLDTLRRVLPPSWSQRLGYWSHAIGWLGDHPLRGWGLEASRMFSPGIQLHPHDSALQLWMELGLIGAVAASVIWASVLARLSNPERDAARAAAAASAMAYVVIGGVSFGVWQEWWLALAGLAAACAAALIRQPVVRSDVRKADAVRKPSTLALFSE